MRRVVDDVNDGGVETVHYEYEPGEHERGLLMRFAIIGLLAYYPFLRWTVFAICMFMFLLCLFAKEAYLFGLIAGGVLVMIWLPAVIAARVMK